MGFTEYPVRDGERIREVQEATHAVRTSVASLMELLAQIGEQKQALEFAESLAVEETRRSLEFVIRWGK